MYLFVPSVWRINSCHRSRVGLSQTRSTVEASDLHLRITMTGWPPVLRRRRDLVRPKTLRRCFSLRDSAEEIISFYGGSLDRSSPFFDLFRYLLSSDILIFSSAKPLSCGNQPQLWRTTVCSSLYPCAQFPLYPCVLQTTFTGIVKQRRTKLL